MRVDVMHGVTGVLEGHVLLISRSLSTKNG